MREVWRIARRRAHTVRFPAVQFLTDLGIGIAIGMLAGTTGTQGGARGRMVLLAAIVGLVVGFLIDGVLGAVLAAVGAAVACLVISDLVFGASRREGSGGGALGFIVALAALIVVWRSRCSSPADHRRRDRADLARHAPATAAPSANTPASASSVNDSATGRGPPSSIIDPAMPGDRRKKLILTYVDSLRTDMLRRAIDEGRAPSFGALVERGVLIEDCVSSFPSVTPVACSEMVTGVGADQPLDQRHELVPPARAALRRVRLLARGDPRLRRLPRALRPRLQHEPGPPQPGDRDALREPRRRRRPHRLHAVPDLPRPPPPRGLARRADAAGGRRDPAEVPPPHLGPEGALLRRPLREPGGPLQVDLDPRRPRSLRRLLRGRADEGGRLRLPPPLAARQRQLLAPQRARGDGRVDRQGRRMLRHADRAGGRDRPLPRRARGDPGRRPRPDRRSTAACRWPRSSPPSGRCCSPPRRNRSWRSWRSARPAAPPTSTCCPARASGPTRRRWGRGWPRSRASTWSAGCSTPRARRSTGPSRGCRAAGDEWAVVERARRAAALPARRPTSPTCAAARWEIDGELGVLEARVEDGKLRSDDLPRPAAAGLVGADRAALGRLRALARADGFEAVDWGGASHAGGGSHGALHAGDSLGPLLFVGCGPESADEREQWTPARRRPGGPRTTSGSTAQ